MNGTMCDVGAVEVQPWASAQHVANTEKHRRWER